MKKTREFLKNHEGPLLVVANHISMIDSILFTYPIPFRILYPWHVPDKDNFNYEEFKGLKRLWWKFFYYTGRMLPIDRKGKSLESEKQRALTYEKMLWVLEQGDALFIFPELTRSRQGWFERNKVKDFIGRLLLHNKNLPVLAVYGRGEKQQSYCNYPEKGEKFRLYSDYFVPQITEEEKKEAGATIKLANQVFAKISELQDKWFAEIPRKHKKIKRSCAGNDVIDLKSKASHRRFYQKDSTEIDMEYVESILCQEELESLVKKSKKKQYKIFWQMFAAKEAAYKALAQAEIFTPHGTKGYRSLKVNLRKKYVSFEPYDHRVGIRFDMNEDYIHCLAVYRGGWVGDKFSAGNVLSEVRELPEKESKWEYKRELLKDMLVEKYPEFIHSKLDIQYENDIPVVYYSGKFLDAGLSFSDCGRYVAVSFLEIPSVFLENVMQKSEAISQKQEKKKFLRLASLVR